MATKIRLSHDDYTVGWICALPLEMAAAKVMLDEVHEDLPVQRNDHNTYILGRIRNHNTVIACLPSGEYGMTMATAVAMQLLSSFHSIRFSLMVGIGGGVPSREADIRLGDIVVSKPTNIYGGVVQYDYGKALSGGEFQRVSMLNRPPQVLLTALSKLQANHLTAGSQVVDFLAEIKQKIPQQASNFARPTQEDHLYLSNYGHVDVDFKTCCSCDPTKIIPRPSRDHDEPVVHYGLIGSANQVVKDSQLRDRLSRELGVYCLEMEAAGLMNIYPCLVVRGICDYADSHKNKEWQGYASAAAAAYAKELLLCTSISNIDQTKTARDVLSDSASRYHVPLDLTGVPAIETFLGRHKELEHLWHHLQPRSSKLRKVAILHGLGGIGKTQLAVRFARHHKDDFTAIFWLSGKSRETLLQSLSSVLSQLPGQAQTVVATNEEEVEQNSRQVLKWLATPGNTHWLLIFDNIDQYSPVPGGLDDGYDVTEFFPTADHGSILITSRLQRLSELGKSFPVQILESEDAIQLLLQTGGLSVSSIVLEVDEDVITLTDRLGRLPLAIVIAGAYIRETGTSIREYLQFYQESWHDLQSLAKPGRDYQQGNMLQTWLISYHEVQKRDPNAAELILLLAHFDNRDIWYELVKCGIHSLNRPKWFDSVISNRLTFKESMRTLIEFSLVTAKHQEGSYTMHPVVQDWCTDIADMTNDSEPNRWAELALVSVGYMVPSRTIQNYWEVQQRLLDHADYVYQGWDSNRLTHDIAIWAALDGLGILYSDQGRLKEAEKMYERALTGREKALGPDHISTLESVHNLGNLYYNQGKLKEAEKMYERALTGREKVLGPNHTSTLDSVHCLGILYSSQGKLKKAEKMYEQALIGYEKVLSLDHISIFMIAHNLGNLYSSQGKLKEAEKMYEQALTGYKKALGPNHTSTLDSVQCLGSLYRGQGRLKEAEKMYEQALIGHEKALGPYHISTLMTVHNLGNLYSDQGKLKEAEKMYERAFTGREKALGPDHISTLDSVHCLGILYSNQEKFKEAEKMYKRAFTGREKALGPDHISTLDSVYSLGNLYANLGKVKEAEKMYKQALTGYKKALGPDHTSTLNSLHNLGNLYSSQGKLKEAEKMYEQALTGYKKALGPDHLSTLGSFHCFGILYRGQGKLKEAEKMYEQALAGYEKALGPNHISTLMTVNNLGNVYLDEGKLKEAEIMYQRALAGTEKALGPDHTSTLLTVNNLGNLYRVQGKLKEAEVMYQRALAGYKKALGPDHTSTLQVTTTLDNLISEAPLSERLVHATGKSRLNSLFRRKN